jgi:hypothetical protein
MKNNIKDIKLKVRNYKSKLAVKNIIKNIRLNSKKRTNIRESMREFSSISMKNLNKGKARKRKYSKIQKKIYKLIKK